MYITWRSMRNKHKTVDKRICGFTFPLGMSSLLHPSHAVRYAGHSCWWCSCKHKVEKNTVLNMFTSEEIFGNYKMALINIQAKLKIHRTDVWVSWVLEFWLFIRFTCALSHYSAMFYQKQAWECINHPEGQQYIHSLMFIATSQKSCASGKLIFLQELWIPRGLIAGAWPEDLHVILISICDWIIYQHL